jgi:hypothetical protein
MATLQGRLFPHPLLPPLLKRKEGVKERGADAPLELPMKKPQLPEIQTAVASF